MANSIDFIVKNGLQVVSNLVVGSYSLRETPVANGAIISGRVGIGTSFPSQQLHLAGNALIQSVMSTGITYTGIGLDISGQDSTPTAVYMSNDGSKLYVLGNTSDRIYQYVLGTPWDLASAVFDKQSIQTTSQVNGPGGMVFNGQGTKIWITGTSTTGAGVWEYNLSTPWDISTLSYANASLTTTAIVGAPTGISFRSDGRRVYLMNVNSGTAIRSVVEYQLNTPWTLAGTVTNASVSTFSVASQETNPQGVNFTRDGSRMFVIGSTGDDITYYDLSTPWVITTARHSGQWSLSSLVPALTVPTGMFIRPDGGQVYIANDIGTGTGNVTLYQFDAQGNNFEVTGSTWLSGELTVGQNVTVYGGFDGFTATYGGNVGIGTASPQLTLDVYGNARITANAATTSSTTGAFVVTGNVGIGGNVNLGQSISLTNATQQYSIRINGAGQMEFIPNQFASAAGTPVMVLDDDSLGLSVTGNITASSSLRSGNLSVTNTTQSTSTTTGAFITAGGAGIAGNLFVGGSINGANVNVTGSAAPPNGIFLPAANTLGFSAASTERMRINSVGNVSIGSTSGFTLFQVGNKVTDDNSFLYEQQSAYVINQTPTTSTLLNDPRTVMLLGRQGTSGQAFGAAAEFRLSRYENSGTASRTRLDISLAHVNFLNVRGNVMTLLSSGAVGIGTASPSGNLHVMGNITVSNSGGFISGIRFQDGSFQKTAFLNTTAVRQSFTATGGQTTFTVAGGYTPGQIDVYYNGVKLINGTEVVVSSGTAVVLTTPATAGADVDVVAYPAMDVADAVRKSGDTMTGDLAINPGNLIVNSTDFVVNRITGNVGIGTASALARLHVMGNVFVSNTASSIGGIRFPDGTFQTTAATSTVIPPGVNSASNVAVTSTATNATFYPAFVENTTGNLGIRVDTGFTYNPSTETLVLQALSSAAATALSVDSGTTGALNIGTAASAKNITIGNLTGATRLFVNTGTGGTTFHVPGAGVFSVVGTSVPTTDMVQINPRFSIATAGVNALAVTYVGGAAAIESSATRTDLTPSGTSGSTWSGYRVVANGAVAGVTLNAMKVDNITASAGTNNALWIGSGWGNVINLGNSVLIRGDGSYAGRVNNINVISTTTAATFYPSFFENTTGALAPRVDPELTYLPGVSRLTAGSFEPFSTTAPPNGMFRPAANTLAFATNSGEKIRIDSLGNVSIGTTAVNYASANRTVLTLSGPSESLLSFAVAGSARGYLRTDGTSMVLQSDTGDTLLYTGGTGAVVLGTRSIARVRVDASGNVGIGTTTPLGNLHVMGNLWLSNNAAFIGGIRFPDGTFQTTAATAGGGAIPSGVNSASNVAITSTSTSATFYPTFVENTTGNLGIRVDAGITYNPGSDSLSVAGTITTATWNGATINLNYGGTGLSTYANGDMVYATTSGTAFSKLAITGTGVGSGNILLNNGSAPTWGRITLSNQNSVTGTLAVGNGGTGTSTQFTQGSVVFAGASGVYSQNNGQLFWDNTDMRLGIGTTTPAGNLHVMGNIILANAGTLLGGIRFPDGTFQTTASTGGAIPPGVNSASNVTITATATNASFYPAFVETNTGNLGIRADLDFSYNPSTNQLTAGAFIPSSATVPSNGIYLPSANTIGVSAGSGERMRITSAGRVGIGTATPSSNLHVMGNITISNSAGFTSGITFPDGTFQQTAPRTVQTTFTFTTVNNTTTTFALSPYTSANSYIQVFVNGVYQPTNTWSWSTTNLVLNQPAPNGATVEVTVYTSISLSAGNNFVSTTSSATNATFYPVFTAATSGIQGVNADGDLTYNPSTNLMSVGAINITGTTVPTNGIFRPAANTLGFVANGAEDMRIDTNGNVSIGTTTTTARLTVNGSATATPLVSLVDTSANNSRTLSVSATSSAAGAGIALLGNGATTPNKFIRSCNGVFEVVNSGYTLGILALTDGGALSAVGEITAYSSDGRLKGNVAVIPDALSRVLSIDGVTFDWLPKTEELGFIPTRKRDVGVIAQRIRDVLPEAVALAPFDRDPADPTKSKSGENYLTVQYEKLTALLIEAVKEQQQVIERQGARISNLEEIVNGMTQGSIS